MKIVLNKEEIKSIRNLVNTIDDINGVPASRVKELVDQTITTRAYIASILTGQLTIELNEEMTLEFLTITNSLLKESTPILKACFSLGQALAPTFNNYGSKYIEFFNRYSEPMLPEGANFYKETVNESEVA